MSRKIAVIGLGYVGLPLAVALSHSYQVLGFDLSVRRVKELCQGIDCNDELSEQQVLQPNLKFTSDTAQLRSATLFIVTVPTPVDAAHVPDLTPLKSASEIVGRVLKKADIVVYESTVYPGCTEEVCLPVLQALSNLQAPQDFVLGYSPERINPGDEQHTLATMTKVVSAQTEAALSELVEIYGTINGGKIHAAADIKTAEAAKVIENTQRDLNIALMNELSMLFHHLGLSTQQVLKAAATKWNFLRFQPGLVGGHCIPVDPYYLTHKAEMLGYHPQIILAGRRINDRMANYVAFEILKLLARLGLSAGNCSFLVMGTTFKADVRDLRNSQVFDLLEQLGQFSQQVEVYDPVPDQDMLRQKGVKLISSPCEKDYDVIVLAVAHSLFAVAGYPAILQGYYPKVFVDLTGQVAAEQLSSDCHFWQL